METGIAVPACAAAGPDPCGPAAPDDRLRGTRTSTHSPSPRALKPAAAACALYPTASTDLISSGPSAVTRRRRVRVSPLAEFSVFVKPTGRLVHREISAAPDWRPRRNWMCGPRSFTVAGPPVPRHRLRVTITSGARATFHGSVRACGLREQTGPARSSGPARLTSGDYLLGLVPLQL